MTERITEKQIEALIETLEAQTVLKLGYTKSYDNYYQLYVEGSETEVGLKELWEE